MPFEFHPSDFSAAIIDALLDGEGDGDGEATSLDHLAELTELFDVG